MLKVREEELNMVTGADMCETEDDSYELSRFGLVKRKYTVGELIFGWVKYSGEVDAGWAKAGITSVTKPFAANKYFKNGKEITQDLAWYMLEHR